MAQHAGTVHCCALTSTSSGSAWLHPDKHHGLVLLPSKMTHGNCCCCAVSSQSGAVAGSRLQSAGASSTAGSHAADAARRSTGGAAMGSRQGRVTKDFAGAAVDPALASKANR